MINIRDIGALPQMATITGTTPTWVDVENPYEGLKAAVHNGQMRLALDYIVVILNQQRNIEVHIPQEIDSSAASGAIELLKAEIEDLKTIVASLAPSRKVSKKPTEPTQPVEPIAVPAED